jgi:lysophospholipase L1-like esterase
MPAMNGFAVSFRKGRLIGCCMAAVLVVSALLASSASAAKAPLTPTKYVAMGDSISYGYSQQKFEENEAAGEPPSAFEGGFVNLLTKKLASLEKKSGNALTSINLSCPGEVSDGLIGENPALGGGGTKENGAVSDAAPCAWHNVDGLPRHFEYGPVSQLEAAIGIVTAPETYGATKYVTTQIGSNDELAVVAACETAKYNEERGFTGGLDECLVVEAGEEGTRPSAAKEKPYYEGGLFHHIIANTGDEVGVLRHEGYTGLVGILGFYNPQAIVLPGSDAIQKKLNETFEYEVKPTSEGGAEAFGPGVVYADPFSKINPQKKTAVEQAAICKYTEYCNVKDKEANYVKYLESHYGFSHEQAEEYKEAHKAEAEAFPEGDIHPTEKGHKLFAKLLFEAFTTGKSTGGV